MTPFFLLGSRQARPTPLSNDKGQFQVNFAVSAVATYNRIYKNFEDK